MSIPDVAANRKSIEATRRATFSEAFQACLKDAGLDKVLVDAVKPLGALVRAVYAETIKKRFQEKLNDCGTPNPRAIEFRFCEAVSDEALTYKQSLDLKQWWLDYLSLRDNPQQSMPD